MIPGVVASQSRNAVAPSVTYATLDPANKSADITLSNGNLTALKGGASDALKSVRSTLSVSSGKHYFEVHVDVGATSTFMLVGVGTSGVDLTSYVGANASGWAYYEDTGQKVNGGTLSTYGANWKTDGIVIGIALDMDNGKVWFSRAGVWQGSGDPASGANPAFTGLSGAFYAYLSLYKKTAPADQLTANFGASAFTYAAPAGFRSGLYQ